MLIRSTTHAIRGEVGAIEHVLCCCLAKKVEEVEGLDEGNVTFSALAGDSEVARALCTRLPKPETTKESIGVFTPVRKSRGKIKQTVRRV